MPQTFRPNLILISSRMIDVIRYTMTLDTNNKMVNKGKIIHTEKVDQEVAS